MAQVDNVEIENYLNNFRKWIHEQEPILHSLDTDEFLLRFLRVTDFQLDNAKERLIYYWKYRTENPQWFTNRDLIKNSVMSEIADTAYCLQLPNETKDKQLIFLMRVGHFDTTKYTLNDVTKYAFAVTDILNIQSAAQIYGFIIILDFSEINLQHVKQFTPDHVKRYVDCWEKMYPVQLRQIHFYNYPALFDPILHLFRMFFYRNFHERIHFHARTSTDAMNRSLHKYIDPSLLPFEYGGQLGAIAGEMNKSFIHWTRDFNDHMMQLEQYNVDLKQVSQLLKIIKKRE